MKIFLLNLISKKVIINGIKYAQKPESGLRKKFFEYLSESIFQEKFKKTPKYTVEEMDLVIEKTERLFKKENFAYQIDIRDSSSPIMQIVHPIMITDLIQTVGEKEFGFSIYNVFDTTIEKEKRDLVKFKNHFSETEYLEIEVDEKIIGIIIQCGLDKKMVKTNTTEILNIVYNKSMKTEYEFSLHNNGKIE